MCKVRFADEHEEFLLEPRHEDYWLGATAYGRTTLPQPPLLHRIVLGAASLACLFLAGVCSFSICASCVLADIDAGAAPTSRHAAANQTCFSGDVGAEWQPQARAFQYNGVVRQTPLPKRTPWRSSKKAPAVWPAPNVPKGKTLWYVRGDAYDLSDFVERHPGGRRYLQNTINSDVTELFEAHHVGYTAARTLATFLVSASPGVAPPPKRPHGGHASLRFKALKAEVASRFDLNALKEPSREYSTLYAATVGAHLALFGGCLLAPSASAAWLFHSGLGVTVAWLGAFAHNGLHMWSRRRLEALGMYLTFSNNPFRWMQKHIVSHHVHTNTCFDGDKTVVPDFQSWWQTMPFLNVFGLTLGTFIIGVKSSCCQAPESLSMTPLEQKLPLLILAVATLLGLWLQGWRWVPRFVWTMAIASTYTFVLFQVSHYQPQTLDGDAIHATSDDWADFQLRTTWGWWQTARPLLCLPWLFLNLQPGHHIFPAVHHSQLRAITPTIRAHYPGLMDDHAVLPMVRSMFAILFGRECLQCVDDRSCRAIADARRAALPLSAAGAGGR